MKQTMIVLLLAGATGLGATGLGATGLGATGLSAKRLDATWPGEADTAGGRFENLRVLPRNIPARDLQGIMADDFEDGLGVSCGFCHAPAKGGHGLDFASDARPEKTIARRMMRMTMALNKKYFRVRKPATGADALTVTCSTCHKGQPFPDGN